MNLETLILTKENHVATIKFNRPNVLNAINAQTMDEIGKVMEDCANDDDIRAIIITGEGKAFAAGADLKPFKHFSVDDAKQASKKGIDIYRRIELMEKCVIAAINGFALGGGCELAMACDIRIASEKAKFGQPEIKLGIIPGYGGTQRLTRLIGRGRAKMLILTGDMINASTAETYGLVDMIVPPEKLMEEAMQLASKIVNLSPLAIKKAKHAINAGIETDLDTGSVIENQMFAECFGTEDAKEGISAFIEKRPPKFIGK